MSELYAILSRNVYSINLNIILNVHVSNVLVLHQALKHGAIGSERVRQFY
jgi:hypothetical protein